MITNETFTKEELIRSIHEDSYFDFFCWAWNLIPGNPPLKVGPHIELIANELQIVGERMIAGLPKEYDLIINVPPGSSKSSLATIVFPIWLWLKKPESKIISGSHSGTLSIQHAVGSRDIMRDPRWEALYGHKFTIRKDVDSKTRYKNNLGGERMITSAGGKITGSHADIILVDDPIDPKGVQSDAVLETVNNWMNKTLPTRVKDKEVAPTILIMQRLHENDPTGNWLQKSKDGKKRIRHICLPATDEYPVSPDSAKKIYVNGLLDPKRMNKKVLDDMLGALGDEEYAGQFGQQPAPPGGLIIKKAWLPTIDYVQLPEGLRKAPMDFVSDTAQKANEGNDPSAILAYKVYRGYLFLFDYVCRHVEFPDLVDMAVDFTGRLGDEYSLFQIEPKSSGSSLVQHLKKFTDLNVIEWKMPDGDKIARAKSITPFLRSGKVYVVNGPWVSKFIQEVTTFPRAPHDEGVDTLVMACHEAFVNNNEANGYSAHT